jgi:ATP/maltotriose-dependent transcriptional regulator MalT
MVTSKSPRAIVGNTVNVAAEPKASAMGPDVRPETVRSSAAPAGRDGIISRGELLARLAAAGLVTVVSAPPGSGKTVLLRSWISAAGLADRVGWVSVPGGERDEQRFTLRIRQAPQLIQHRRAQLLQGSERQLHLRLDPGHPRNVQTSR